MGVRPAFDHRPSRLHHAAWSTTDSEATRRFYEDVLGFPLVATWCELDPFDGSPFVHTMYEIGDGGCIAFFELSDPAKRRDRAIPFPGHLALKVDASAQEELRSRLEVAGHKTDTIDHGYCVSLYVTDPNGFFLEFTMNSPHFEAVDERQRATAHAELKRWLAGDHAPNNDHRTH